jgi:3-deoxy-D-manno-octulosonate 8-phosphate phosphatase (KDO 8-P phosphatase)
MEHSGMDDPSTIKLLLLDVDGVMTDGSVWIDDRGRETKRFHVRDGLGIQAAGRSGLTVGLLTARTSRATAARARELGIELLIQGATDKRAALHEACMFAETDRSQIAYLGDDLYDLPVLEAVGYPMAVADAATEVRQRARFVTTLPGGHGAVREAIEHLLRPTGRWEALVQSFLRQ